MMPYADVTSDSGWGCMLRTAQMLMAQALQRDMLGRDWRLPTNVKMLRSTTEYRDIVKWFLDYPGPPYIYSIHHLAQCGMRYDKLPGEWYGPSTAAHVLKDLASIHRRIFRGHLDVCVAQDGIVYKSEVERICTTSIPVPGHSEITSSSLDIISPISGADKKESGDDYHSDFSTSEMSNEGVDMEVQEPVLMHEDDTIIVASNDFIVTSDMIAETLETKDMGDVSQYADGTSSAGADNCIASHMQEEDSIDEPNPDVTMFAVELDTMHSSAPQLVSVSPQSLSAKTEHSEIKNSHKIDNIRRNAHLNLEKQKKSFKGIISRETDENNDFFDPLFNPPPEPPREPWKTSLMLIVPLRLGKEKTDPEKFNAIKSLFRSKYTLGIMGGWVGHAVFFVGYRGDKLLGMDPHVTYECPSPWQSTLSQDTFPSDKLLKEIHVENLQEMDFSQLDPSVAIAFYFRDRDEFDSFCKDKAEHTEVLEKHGPSGHFGSDTVTRLLNPAVGAAVGNAYIKKKTFDIVVAAKHHYFSLFGIVDVMPNVDDSLGDTISGSKHRGEDWEIDSQCDDEDEDEEFIIV